MNTLEHSCKVVEMKLKRERDYYAEFLRRQAEQLTKPAVVIKIKSNKKQSA